MRKRHAAEELAQEAPIKMIFPLATCFFPAILIVAAGPGVLALLNALGKLRSAHGTAERALRDPERPEGRKCCIGNEGQDGTNHGDHTTVRHG